MLATHYAELRFLHVGCVALSGSLFTFRGLLRIKRSPLATHRALRAASYLIDTTLLVAAVLLTFIIHQYPFVNGWLTAKVLLLALYIGLGIITLQRARTTWGRSMALAGSLLTFAAILAIAILHHFSPGRAPLPRRLDSRGLCRPTYALTPIPFKGGCAAS
jgi:uncharacterized membrane protein SirB2